MQRSSKVEIRTTDLEKADWQKAAGGARLVSSWLRSLANAECARLRSGEKQEAEQIIAAVSEHPRPESKPLTVADAIERSASGLVEGITDHAPRDGKPLAVKCPRAHHHRPGRYCGACKKVATKVGE